MAGTNNSFLREKLQHFLELPEERVILYTRQHYLLLIPPLFLLTLSMSIFFSLSLAILSMTHVLYFLIPLLFCLIAFFLSSVTKIIVDWYFHLYVVTTHKLVEVSYSPFFIHKTNTILLDQVRCTEIDENKNGIFEEIFDFGNITLTFDRPTHSEEFVLYHISRPTAIAAKLRNFLTHNEELEYIHVNQSPNPIFFGRRISYT